MNLTANREGKHHPVKGSDFRPLAVDRFAVLGDGLGDPDGSDIQIQLSLVSMEYMAQQLQAGSLITLITLGSLPTVRLTGLHLYRSRAKIYI